MHALCYDFATIVQFASNLHDTIIIIIHNEYNLS